MNNDLTRAKEILEEKQFSFVLIREGRVIKTSYQKGVIPWIEVIREDDHLLEKAIIADRVMGRAAALLAVHYQVKALYAEIISIRARELLDSNSLFYQFNQSVDYIKNRANNGPCPLEELTQSISDPSRAYGQILQFYRNLLKIDI